MRGVQNNRQSLSQFCWDRHKLHFKNVTHPAKDISRIHSTSHKPFFALAFSSLIMTLLFSKPGVLCSTLSSIVSDNRWYCRFSKTPSSSRTFKFVAAIISKSSTQFFLSQRLRHRCNDFFPTLSSSFQRSMCISQIPRPIAIACRVLACPLRWPLQNKLHLRALHNLATLQQLVLQTESCTKAFPNVASPIEVLDHIALTYTCI